MHFSPYSQRGEKINMNMNKTINENESLQTPPSAGRGAVLFDVYPINNITITKAQGSYVWDENGVQYLDMYGGHAVISIGHSHPYWVKRIEEQMQKISFYSNSVRIPLQQ